MIIDGHAHQLPDIDPSETSEWVESLDGLIGNGRNRREQFVACDECARTTRRPGGAFPGIVVGW